MGERPPEDPNTCLGIAELMGECMATLRVSPALVCLRLTQLRRLVGQQKGLRCIAHTTNNEMKIQLCQWVKDGFNREVVVRGVFTAALTSRSAARRGNEYLDKRSLRNLVRLARAEAATNKRNRVAAKNKRRLARERNGKSGKHKVRTGCLF